MEAATRRLRLDREFEASLHGQKLKGVPSTQPRKQYDVERTLDSLSKKGLMETVGVSKKKDK